MKKMVKLLELVRLHYFSLSELARILPWKRVHNVFYIWFCIFDIAATNSASSHDGP